MIILIDVKIIRKLVTFSFVLIFHTLYSGHTFPFPNSSQILPTFHPSNSILSLSLKQIRINEKKKQWRCTRNADTHKNQWKHKIENHNTCKRPVRLSFKKNPKVVQDSSSPPKKKSKIPLSSFYVDHLPLGMGPALSVDCIPTVIRFL